MFIYRKKSNLRDQGIRFGAKKTLVKIENLSAGSYILCITMVAQPSYKQCFTIVVIEPDELIVNAGRLANSSELKLSLSGREFTLLG